MPAHFNLSPRQPTLGSVHPRRADWHGAGKTGGLLRDTLVALLRDTLVALVELLYDCGCYGNRNALIQFMLIAIVKRQITSGVGA